MFWPSRNAGRRLDFGKSEHATSPSFNALSVIIGIFSAVALLTGLAIRCFGFTHAPPLWIDETFTGAIAGLPSFADVISLARFDSPPISYYLFMHVWVQAFGLSDAALRAPSLAFSVAAPLIILLGRCPGLTRSEHAAWAALLALWIPGIGFAQDARFYALVLMFAVIQTITFQKLLVNPTFLRTSIWMASAVLTMLTHFDAAYLALAQGVIFVVLHHRSAFKAWPTVLLATPVFAEILWRWPTLSHFAQTGTAWYPMLRPLDLVKIYLYVFGGFGIGAIICLLILPIWLLSVGLIGTRSTRLAHDPRITALVWVAASAFFACALMVSVGFMRPSFTWRYLAPFEPGMLLGLLMVTRRLARHSNQFAYAGLIVISLGTCISWRVTGADLSDSYVRSLSIAQASENLMKNHSASVLFAWQSRSALALPPKLLAAVGGFFFERANVPVLIKVVQLNPYIDPNVQILDAAAPLNSSIIWLYDLSALQPTAKRFTPRIGTSNLYSCENFGAGPIGSFACHPISRRAN